MIQFATPREREFGITNYLEEFDPQLGERLQPLHYESLLERDAIPLGTYALTAFDDLTPAEIDLVHRLRAAVNEADPGAVLLNDPSRVLLRAPLLQALYAAGRNDFSVVPATADLRNLRFPVFVREADRHTGSLTDLLPDRHSLARALAKLRLKGYRLADLLVVEFCDTAGDNGLYAKYSAYIVGQRVIARAIVFSDQWVTKHAAMMIDEELARTMYEFVDTNPHEPWLAEIFAIAGVEYGRVDYGIHDGKPQVWEVNLNPTVGRGPGLRHRTPAQQRALELRAPALRIFGARFREAWAALDRGRPGEIEWRVDDATRRAIAAQRRDRARRERRIARRTYLLGSAPVRSLTRLLRGSASR